MEKLELPFLGISDPIDPTDNGGGAVPEPFCASGVALYVPVSSPDVFSDVIAAAAAALADDHALS